MAREAIHDEPLTIQRLRALRRGETFVYYTGNKELDMASALPNERAGDRVGAPKYRDLLEQIFRVADQLAAKGKVRLTQRKTGLLGTVEYKATGV